MANGLSPNGNKVRMGTISHGTLRTQDLLRTFADELDYLGWSNRHRLCIDARRAADLLDEKVNGMPVAPQHIEDTAGAILEELFDVLNEACPSGVYFGSSEGDGSDFGFWELDLDDRNDD